MKLKNLFLAVVALSLAACAFDKDKGLTGENELDNRQLLKQSFEKVAGTYAGVIRTVNGDETIQIKLTVLEEENGRNSNNLPIMHPVLVATYFKKNPAGMGYEFKVRPYEETGEWIFTNKNTTTLTRDDVHTITAKINGNKISGKALSSAGFLGNLELELTTRETGNNGNTEENEYYDNLYKQYEAIAGIYRGKFVSDNPAEASDEISLEVIAYKMTPTGSSIAIPVITATLKYNKDPYGISDYKFTATYNTNVSPRRLTLNGKSVYTGSMGQLDLEGVLNGDEFLGTYFRQPKFSKGTFVLKKDAK